MLVSLTRRRLLPKPSMQAYVLEAYMQLSLVPRPLVLALLTTTTTAASAVCSGVGAGAGGLRASVAADI